MKVGGNESATKFFQQNGGTAALNSKDSKTKYQSSAATKYKDELKRRAARDAKEFVSPASSTVFAFCAITLNCANRDSADIPMKLSSMTAPTTALRLLLVSPRMISSPRGTSPPSNVRRPLSRGLAHLQLSAAPRLPSWLQAAARKLLDQPHPLPSLTLQDSRSRPPVESPPRRRFARPPRAADRRKSTSSAQRRCRSLAQRRSLAT